MNGASLLSKIAGQQRQFRACPKIRSFYSTVSFFKFKALTHFKVLTNKFNAVVGSIGQIKPADYNITIRCREQHSKVGSVNATFTLPTLLFESSMTAGKLKAPFSESLTLKN